MDIRTFIDASALMEKLYKKRPCVVVCKGLALPCEQWVEDFIRTILRHLLVMESDNISHWCVGFLVVEPVDLLESRCCDFFNVVAYLYLWLHHAVFFNCHKLVHTTENWLRLCSNKSLPNSKGINLCSLGDQILYYKFIQAA